MHLYEAHLPVSDTEAARKFYVEIVGLKFAHRDLMRDIVFLWAGADRRSMLSLWGPTTAYAGERLNAANIKTQNFAGEETTEPSVIGWMPSAQLYFRDRDGHSLEFITLLNESSEPNFNGSLSEWRQRKRA